MFVFNNFTFWQIKMKVLRTVAALLVLGCTCALGDFSARPAFHYSPPQGWINDPMLVVSNNSFHVLIDCDPSSVLPPWAPGSNSSYCHATSSDMVNWQAQPVAETAARGTGSLLAADDLTAAARAALPAGETESERGTEGERKRGKVLEREQREKEGPESCM